MKILPNIAKFSRVDFEKSSFVCKLKHSPSRELPLTARETVFSQTDCYHTLLNLRSHVTFRTLLVTHFHFLCTYWNTLFFDSIMMSENVETSSHLLTFFKKNYLISLSVFKKRFIAGLSHIYPHFIYYYSFVILFWKLIGYRHTKLIKSQTYFFHLEE